MEQGTNERIEKSSDIFIRDLYQEYQNWSIDVEKEQRLLLEYDRIVLQFPFIGSAVRLF